MSNDRKYDRHLEARLHNEERNRHYLTMSCEQLLAMSIEDVQEFYRVRDPKAATYVCNMLAPYADRIADRFFEAHRTGDTVTMTETIAEWKASSGLVAVAAWLRLTDVKINPDPEERQAATIEAHRHVAMKVLASFKVFSTPFVPPTV